MELADCYRNRSSRGVDKAKKQGYEVKILLIISLILTGACSKSRTADPEQEPPYTVTLNHQNTEYNCVILGCKIIE